MKTKLSEWLDTLGIGLFVIWLNLVFNVMDYFLTSSPGSANVWMISLCTAAGPVVTLWPWPCVTQAWGTDTAASVRRTVCLRSTWTAACRHLEVHTEATTQSRRSKVKKKRKRRRRKGRMTTMIVWWGKTLTLKWDNKRHKCACPSKLQQWNNFF